MPPAGMGPLLRHYQPVGRYSDKHDIHTFYQETHDGRRTSYLRSASAVPAKRTWMMEGGAVVREFGKSAERLLGGSYLQR